MTEGLHQKSNGYRRPSAIGCFCALIGGLNRPLLLDVNAKWVIMRFLGRVKNPKRVFPLGMPRLLFQCADHYESE